MKIIVAVSGTKNNSPAVSGSTSTPMRKLVSAVGPSGSHVTALAITDSPKCSVPSTLKNTTSESTHVSTIDAMATMSLRRLFPRVKSRMIKKASSGGRGINQIGRASCRERVEMWEVEAYGHERARNEEVDHDTKTD